MTYGRTSVVLSLLVLLSMTSCGEPSEAIDGPVATPITQQPRVLGPKALSLRGPQRADGDQVTSAGRDRQVPLASSHASGLFGASLRRG